MLIVKMYYIYYMYSTSNIYYMYYKSSNISIAAVIKNPGMLKFVPNRLETKQLCNCGVKKLPFLIRYISNQYKTKKCVIKLF